MLRRSAAVPLILGVAVTAALLAGCTAPAPPLPAPPVPAPSETADAPASPRPTPTHSPDTAPIVADTAVAELVLRVDGLEAPGGATTVTNYEAVVDGHAAGPVLLGTVHGIRVGDDGQDVEAMLGVAPERMSCWGPAAEYGPTLGESFVDGEPLAYGVELVVASETGLVRSIVAPRRYGGGCV